VRLLFEIVFKIFRILDQTENMSEKREREDDDKSIKSNASEDDEDECVGPSLSELTDTVEKKKRKSEFLL